MLSNSPASTVAIFFAERISKTPIYYIYIKSLIATSFLLIGVAMYARYSECSPVHRLKSAPST